MTLEENIKKSAYDSLKEPNSASNWSEGSGFGVAIFPNAQYALTLGVDRHLNGNAADLYLLPA
jgi:hypothetical protein